MGEFKLDTSGEVVAPAVIAMTGEPDAIALSWRWEDLTPFEQGYIEALFASLDHPGYIDVEPGNDDAGHVPVAFSDLAPEALAMILRDCEIWLAGGHQAWISDPGVTSDGGRDLWVLRQDSKLANFPPLRVYLNDAGKVCLRDPAQQVSTPSSSGEEVVGRTSQPLVARDPAPAITDQPHSDGEG